MTERIRLLYEQAIRQFNTRYFYECHETLEELWMEESRPVRLFYQGLLQVAVGFLHLSNLNIVGAHNLLRRGSDKLERFRPTQYGVDVEALLRDVRACRDEIERLGRERLAEFDPDLIPTIQLGDLRQLEEDWRP